MVRLLGRGGVGTVYEAFDTETGEDVAVKLLPPRAAADARVLSRFLSEGRFAGAVRHPNLVAVRETGAANGLVFLVMDLVRGETCAERLRREGRLPPAEALRVVRAVAEALSAVHAVGIVHRDVKPGNVMIDRQGRVRLSDFGLAKDLHGDDSSLTRPGDLLGTPHYMSPEQCRGERPDARSDIYSLGATLFCLLTGRPPFAADAASSGQIPAAGASPGAEAGAGAGAAGSTGSALMRQIAVMTRHLRDPAPDPRDLRPELPAGFTRVVARAMAKSPDDRYPDAAALIADLDAVAAESAPGPTPPEPGDTVSTTAGNWSRAFWDYWTSDAPSVAIAKSPVSPSAAEPSGRSGKHRRSKRRRAGEGREKPQGRGLAVTGSAPLALPVLVRICLMLATAMTALALTALLLRSLRAG
jgi:serine/threonine protein kinase